MSNSKLRTFIERLSDKHQWQVTEALAKDNSQIMGMWNHPYHMTYHFHKSFDMPVASGVRLDVPVSERILRGRLLFEEVKETLKAMGLTLSMQPYDPGAGDCDDVIDRVEVTHVEGSFYDPVETLDGLADINVIASGTAVQFGLPLPEADMEVFASNMTKLDDFGNPILNRCQQRPPCALHDLGEDCQHLIDTNQPRGKYLKGDKYKPANIVRVIIDKIIHEGN